MTCSLQVFRAVIAGLLALSLAPLSVSSAGAASMRVTMACASDYFAYCSKHDPDSPAVRACFRSNGMKLSKKCVDALVSSGEVSRTEVTRRAASNR